MEKQYHPASPVLYWCPHLSHSDVSRQECLTVEVKETLAKSLQSFSTGLREYTSSTFPVGTVVYWGQVRSGEKQVGWHSPGGWESRGREGRVGRMEQERSEPPLPEHQRWSFPVGNHLGSSFPFPAAAALATAEHNQCILTQVKVSRSAQLIPPSVPALAGRELPPTRSPHAHKEWVIAWAQHRDMIYFENSAVIKS